MCVSGSFCLCAKNTFSEARWSADVLMSKTCGEGMGPSPFVSKPIGLNPLQLASKKNREGLYPPHWQNTLEKGKASPFPATLCQRSKNNNKNYRHTFAPA